MDEIKLFISQPMSNRTTDEILAQRMIIVRKFINTYPQYTFELLDNYLIENAVYDQMKVPDLAYFGTSIVVMAQADVVLFSSDFTTSDGCRMEHALAYNHHMKVIYEDDLNNDEATAED